jgi:hypothetical protein
VNPFFTFMMIEPRRSQVIGAVSFWSAGTWIRLGNEDDWMRIDDA